MKTRRAFAVHSAVVTVAGSFLLAACGGSSGSAASPFASPSGAATPAAERTPAVAARTTPAAPVTQAPPQVIIVQPAPAQTRTQYVQVPAPGYGGSSVRATYRFPLVLGSSGHPDGPFVPMHTGPNASTPQVQRVYDGESYTFDCQTYGGPVYGDWGTSYLWDRVVTPEQVLGYISDEWVHTGSDTPVLPSC